MNGYAYFAEYYDVLTQNVGYEERAEYLLSLLKRHHHTAGLTLDLACGTGSLTLALHRRGVDVFGADASSEMLSMAQQKFMEDGRQTLFLCQKMQDLTLYAPVHTCFCTLDSINHLPSAEDVVRTFRRIADNLEDDGLLVFDCNTVYKHRHILGDNCYIYDTPEVFCAWQNSYFEEQDEVVITLDFFEPDGNGQRYRRYTEQFSERAYTEDVMETMLKQAGLVTEAIYDDLCFSAPRPETQREIFVVRKMNHV